MANAADYFWKRLNQQTGGNFGGNRQTENYGTAQRSSGNATNDFWAALGKQREETESAMEVLRKKREQDAQRMAERRAQYKTDQQFQAAVYKDRYKNADKATIDRKLASPYVKEDEKSWLRDKAAFDTDYQVGIKQEDRDAMAADIGSRIEGLRRQSAILGAQLQDTSGMTMEELQKLQEEAGRVEAELSRANNEQQRLQWSQNLADRQAKLDAYEENRNDPEFSSWVRAGYGAVSNAGKTAPAREILPEEQRESSGEYLDQLKDRRADNLNRQRTILWAQLQDTSGMTMEEIQAAEDEMGRIDAELQNRRAEPEVDRKWNADNKWGEIDPLGAYLDDREEETGRYVDSNGAPIEQNWEYMDDSQKEMYYAILGRDGTDAALEYLDALQISLDKTGQEKVQQRFSDYWNDEDTGALEKTLLNVYSVPANVIGGVVAAGTDLRSVLEDTGYNPYNGGHAAMDMGELIRQETASDIVDAIGKEHPMWGKIASNTYQAVMSGADSLVGAVLFGKGYSAMMGASAASRRAQELWENGASDWEMAVGAIGAGAIETAFEYISLDKFFESYLSGAITDPVDFVKKTLLQGGIEASEEINTELANLIWDSMVTGYNSEWQQEINKLELAGYTHEEALDQARINRMLEVFWAGYGGLVSGGAMGAGGNAINYAAAQRYYADTGSQILQNGSEQNILDQAQSYKDSGGSVNDRLLELAQQKAQQNTQELTGRQQKQKAKTFGRLYSEVTDAQAKDAGAARENAFREEAQRRLEAKGVGNAEEAAAAMTKATYGGKMTMKERAAFERYDGRAVVSEILNDEEFRARQDQAQNEAYDRVTKTMEGSLTESEQNKERARQEGQKQYFREVVQEQLEAQGTQNAEEAAKVVTKAAYDGGGLTAQESRIYESVGGNEIVSEIMNSREFQQTAQVRGEEYQQINSRRIQDNQRARANPVAAQENRAAVEEMAETFRNPEAVTAVYRDGQNAYQFMQAYENAYEMGREDVGLQNAVDAYGAEYLTKDQITAAYEQGRKDAGYGEESVRRGTQWNDRAYAGGEARAVDAAEGGYEAEGTAEGAADEAAAGKVSARQLGIATGTEDRTLTVRQPEQYNADEQEAASVAKEAGKKLVIVRGGAIETTEEVGGKQIRVKARALVTGDTMYVRSDDRMFTAAQISRHEATHGKLDSGEVSRSAVKEKLRKRYTQQQIEAMVDLYANAYGDTGMSAEEVMDEIICDSMGEMNAFARPETKGVTGEVGVFLRNVQRAAKGAASGEAGTQTGRKFSRMMDSDGRSLTRNQQEYFKDSRVRDDGGNLKVMHHGTSNYGFTVFDWDKSKFGLFGKGFYFTDNADVARSYTEKGKGNSKGVYDVYLNITNPIDADADANMGEWYRAFDAFDYDSSYLSDVKTNEDAFRALKEYMQDAGFTKWEAEDAITDLFEYMGYDGITHVGGGRYKASDGTKHRVYIAFHEEQIKNIDNAAPTTNPDIRFSREMVLEAEREVKPTMQTKEAKDTFYAMYDGKNMVGNVQQEIQKSTQFDGKYMTAAAEKNRETHKVGADLMELAAQIRAEMAQKMKQLEADKKIGLPKDVLGNTYFANSSYDGSEENTTICPRSLTSEAFVDAVSEMLGRPLTVAEQVYICQDLQNRTTTPECLYCYVATDRKAYREFLGSYIQQRDAVLDRIRAGETDMKKLYNEFLDGRKPTDNMKKRFDLWVNTFRNGKKLIQASDLTNMQRLMGDIRGEFGAELHDQIKDAMAYAQSASWAKKRVNYVAYNNHILKWSNDRIRKLNSHYGLRMYSFSDFHPAFILENMQMITDASVRGLKMLAYTKDTDFVKIFAGTGMNINISCFGIERDGTIAENNIIGARWDEAQQLRAEHDNVGITFVATNDKLVEWALKQDWIDVVIPYHLVRTGAEVAKALNYTNYTSESADGKAADWKEWSEGKDKKKLIRSIPPTMHNNDYDTYMKALQDNHLTPRFERWRFENGKKNPNYMKLVNECRRSAADSSPVQPVFDLQAARAAMMKLEGNGYYTPIGGDVDHMYEIAHQVSEQIQNGAVQYSREMRTVEDLEKAEKLLKKQLTEARAEAREQQERAEYWKGQTRRTEQKTAREADVRKVTRKLLQQYSSKTKVDSIIDQMQEVADLTVGQTGPGVYDRMLEAAKGAAREILKGSGVDVNADLQEDLKELKSYLRSTPIQVTEQLKFNVVDYEDMRKRYRNVFRFREDGTGSGVDQIWIELQDIFGKGMFPEEVMNPGDQLEHIAAQLVNMESDVQNPYAADMELATRQLALDIMNTINREVNPNPPTKMDKALANQQREMDRLVAEGRERERSRIEKRNAADLRRKIRNIGDKFQKMAQHQGKGDTQHAPAEMLGAVVKFSEALTDSYAAAQERITGELENRTARLMKRMAKEGASGAVKEEYRKIETAAERNSRAITRLQELKAAYAAMKTDGRYQMTYDETVENMLGACLDNLSQALKQGDIYQLGTKQLQQVYNALSTVMYTVTNANKAFSMGKQKTITDMSQKMAAEMRQVNYTAPGMKSILQRYMQWQMTPDTFFSYLCGFIKDNEGQTIQAAFAQGTMKMLEVQREFYELFQPFTETRDKAAEKELKAMMNPTAKTMVEVPGLTDLNGNTVKLSRGMIMQLSMLLDQADSFESMKFGGLSLPNLDVYYRGDIAGSYGNAEDNAMLSRPIEGGYMDLVQQLKEIQTEIDNLSGVEEGATGTAASEMNRQRVIELEKQRRTIQAQMEAMSEGAEARLRELQKTIDGMLTKQEKQLIDTAHKWYDRSGQMMSDVFLQMYGFQPQLVSNYVPIHRDLSSVKTDIRDMAGAEKAFNLENSGFTIERVRSYSPILLTDFFQELESQKGKMSRYVGFAQVQKDFGKIWKCRLNNSGLTINKMVQGRFGMGSTTLGVSGEEYINHYIADVAGGHSENGILNSIYGNYAAATLRFNPRVAVSQAASIPTAASVVGWKSAAVGFAKGLPYALSTDYKNQLARKNALFFQRYRGEGGSTELADLKMKGNVVEKVASSNVGKLLFNWCQNFDVFSTGSIMWEMAEDAVQRKGIQKGSEGYEEAVNQMYTDIIRKSQPNYTTTERSDLLRDKRGGMKMLTMFKTQSNMNLNLLLAANGEFIRMKQDLKNGRNGVTAEDVKAARDKLVNASTGVFLGGTAAFVLLRTAVNFIMGAVNPYRDKETNEITGEATIKAIVKEMFSSVAGMVAMGGQVYDILEAVMSGDKYYGMSDSAISAVSDAGENLVKLLQAAVDPDTKVSEKQIWKAVQSTAMLYGIPAGNAKKVADMISTYIRDIKNGSFGSYSSGDTTKAQYRAQIVKHYLGGETDKAADALTMLWAMSTKDTDDEIRKDLASGMATYLKSRYIAGDLTDLEAERILEYVGRDDPEGTVQKWDFQLEHPEIDNPSTTMIGKYNDRGNIDGQVFLDAYAFAQAAKADYDENGKLISGSKKAKIVAYIQKLRLTEEQKKRLFLLLGAGDIKGTPWE